MYRPRHLSQRERDRIALTHVSQFDENPPAPFDPATLDDAALTAEFGRIRERGQELAAVETLTDEQDAELTELAARLPLVQAEQSRRETAAAERQARRDAFSALEPVSVPETAPSAPVAPETPAAPAAPATPAVTAAVEPRPAAPVVPSVAHLSSAPARPEVAAAPSIRAFVSSDAVGHVGRAAGEEFSGLREIGEALTAAAAQYGRMGGGKGARHAIAQFRRTRDPRLVVNDPRDGNSVIAFARDETRLTGGSLAAHHQSLLDSGQASLTAAAGWCAPSENDYDLCRQWAAGVGLFDAPSITLSRGGINYTSDIDFAEMYAAALTSGITYLTEAEVIADTPKTCIELPCPDFEEVRLAVQALCIRVSFLQAAGYPEVVDAWTDGLLAINEYEMNRRIINQVITRAGAATPIAAPASGPDSFTSAVLAGVELAATDIRARYRMSPQSTIEIVLPTWVLPQMRADLSRRNGVDMLAVTDAQIGAMFTARNVRVQFVSVWQDGLITGGAPVATLPGGDATAPYLTALPNDVSFLAYPAGSVVVARQDVVTLTNVYDSSSLQQNLFTSVFAEEGFETIFPCPGQRLYTLTDICNMGVTGAQTLSCTAPTP